jgi:hypothetical protein
MTVTTVERNRYQDLLEWLRSNGAEVSDKIFIQESSLGGGYGAFISQEVEEGDILFTVPRKCCVTLKDAMDDPKCGKTFGSLIEKAGPGGNTVVMAAFLAKEYLISQVAQQEPSRFGTYFKTLPWERGINNQEHILFWTDEVVDSDLGGSFCYNEAVQLRSEVSLAAKVIDDIVGDSIRIARGELEDGFKWPWQVTATKSKAKPTGPVEGLEQAVRGAFVSLLTRAFQDGDGDEEKLVPMLDMLQHSDNCNVRHAMRKDNGIVEVRARRPIKPGEELLNQYRSEEDGNMPYHRFFTRFGFVPGIDEPIESLLTDKSSIFYPKIVEI